MPGSVVVSRAPNGEDVVLSRALGHLGHVRAVVVTDDPDSASARLAEDCTVPGWSSSVRRAGDDAGGVQQALAVLDGAFSGPLHVLWVVAAGQPVDVFTSLAVAATRPWVVLAPAGAAPVRGALASRAAEAGYTATLFDGVTEYFVAQEHPELMDALSYPRCSRDDYVTGVEIDCQEQNESLLAEVIHWRRLAVTGWADAVSAAQVSQGERVTADRAQQLENELAAMRGTLSWRVTRPLRSMRQRSTRRHDHR